VRKPMAAAGTASFFVMAPGVVAGLVPWWLTGWRVRHPQPPWAWASLRVAGVPLLVAGVIVLVGAFVCFVTEGAGTPAPVAPTQRLVVGGLYRYVRNPMYLAVVATIVGQALALGQPALLQPVLAHAATRLVSGGQWVLPSAGGSPRRRSNSLSSRSRSTSGAWITRTRAILRPQGARSKHPAGGRRAALC
jgi:phospholipid methyltransferase